MNAEQLMKRLSRKMRNGDGTLRRGSISRVAERLNVSPSTVRNWTQGCLPHPHLLPLIADLVLRQPIDLRAKKSGPKGSRRKDL